MKEKQAYRLVTRSDFDGLVCAVLLRELDLIDEVVFVHPKDMQDGKIAITSRDITTNLPYVAACHLAFDHHQSEALRVGGAPANSINQPDAPSAARVVFDYYKGGEVFGGKFDDMMAAVDKGDSAQLSREEILEPKDWVLLNYLMDARTGLGRYRDFRIANRQLMMDLIEHLRNHGIAEILQLPDVRERIEVYQAEQPAAEAQIRRCAQVHGNLVVLDLREEEQIHATNRFFVYALFPQCNISIHVMDGFQKQNIVLAIGKSILDRSSKTEVGELCLQYGGGGHSAAGTCQVSNEQADGAIAELIKRINADG